MQPKARLFRSERVLFYVLGIGIAAFLLYIVVLSYRQEAEPLSLSPISFLETCQEARGAASQPFERKKGEEDSGLSRIVLRGHFSQDIPPNEMLHMYMQNIRVNIRQNGKPILCYGAVPESPHVVTSVGTEWYSFVSPGISRNDEVEIELENVYGSLFRGTFDAFLNNLYIGSRAELLYHQVSLNWPKILISFAILWAGLAMMQMALTSAVRHFLSCGVLLVCGALCTFIHYDYITLLFPKAFFINIIDYLTQLLIVEFLLIYIRTCIQSPGRRRVISGIIYLWSVIVLSFCILQGTGIVEAALLFPRFLLVAAILVPAAMVLLLLEIRRHKDQRMLWQSWSVLLLAISSLVEIMHAMLTSRYWVFLLQFGLLAFAVVQYLVMRSYTRESLERATRAEKMEKEIVQSQISIMLSQIQPHFLYNALVVIRQLCDIDPKKAKEAVTEFAYYLRANMDSLHFKGPIAFEKELRHVENYVSLEKKRFGERIRVQYDIRASDFQLPPLTLQPIMENAIRYGINRKEEGGTVRVSTWAEAEGIRIVVEDDGVGFDPMQVQFDGRSHIGIENVRNRLAAMCGGEIAIESQPGEGTRVTMKIPHPSEILNQT